MLTATATAAGCRVAHENVDSVCVEAVDDVGQTDLEWRPGISTKRSLRLEGALACGWNCLVPR